VAGGRGRDGPAFERTAAVAVGQAGHGGRAEPCRAAHDDPADAGDGLVPTDEDMKARPDDDTSGTTRIEQKRQSNRISEVIVTPAGQSRSYVMTNREGRQPYGEFQTNPGLSVPMFLRFEFGKPTPPTTTPPPPSPSPSR
jgi:hypothetical protein